MMAGPEQDTTGLPVHVAATARSPPGPQRHTVQWLDVAAMAFPTVVLA
jgi:hypothetical protein